MEEVQEVQKTIINLTCKKCNRNWDYKGNSCKIYTSCPNCKTSVKISN